jgi:hypothetical protein
MSKTLRDFGMATARSTMELLPPLRVADLLSDARETNSSVQF